ncbi:MAG TPA: MFS transporter [Thermotogota bacterium]|nr:MFS transporter [Thermotogota bacterium]
MKHFMLIWFGELISCIGSGMTAFAVSVYVYQLTGSAVWVSITTLLAYLPTILLNPVGGILADRYDRRLMMIIGDAFSAIGLLFILIAMQTGHTGVLPICIGITISAIFVSLLEPAYRATITDLLTDQEYAKASGLVQMANSSKFLISPVLAGLILAFSNIQTILIIDIATFFVTVFTVFTVKKHIKSEKKVRKETSFRKEMKEGMKSITGNKVVKKLVILMAFVCFFIAFLQMLMTPMILSFADEKTLGFMESISAIGMLIGSVVISALNIKKNHSGILKVSLMFTGIFMALVGTTVNIPLIIVYCMLFFVALPFVNTCADVLVRKNIPNDLQGRAWGIISVLTQAGFLIAYAISGVLADFVFNPMLEENGFLSGSLGKIIGTGEGRGIGLMLILAGITFFVFAFVFSMGKETEHKTENTYELADQE